MPTLIYIGVGSREREPWLRRPHLLQEAFVGWERMQVPHLALNVLLRWRRVGDKFPLIAPPRKFAGTRHSCNTGVISGSFKAPFSDGILGLKADILWCVPIS